MPHSWLSLRQQPICDAQRKNHVHHMCVCVCIHILEKHLIRKKERKNHVDIYINTICPKQFDSDILTYNSTYTCNSLADVLHRRLVGKIVPQNRLNMVLHYPYMHTYTHTYTYTCNSLADVLHH